MKDKHYDLVVIGGGPAGLSSAIYAGRSNLKVLVIERSHIGSLLMAHKIDNYPGFPEGLTGKQLHSNMKLQAQKYGVNFVEANFLGFDLFTETKTVKTDFKNYLADSIIIATGWAKNLGTKIKGEEEYVGKGVSYCATCDGAFTKHMTVSLFGKGEEVAEEALFLTRYAKEILIFANEENFDCCPEIFKTLSEDSKVKIITNSSLKEIKGTQYVEKVIVEVDGEEKEYDSDYAFLYIGTKTSSELFSEVSKIDEQGYIITDELMKTNIPGIFAAGDVRSKHIRQITTATSDGTIAGMESIKYILTHRKKKQA
ncbi:MAG: NAD(P)/FAD-dependent oxidoreductase, partial [Fusobacteriaceae bacterium]